MIEIAKRIQGTQEYYFSKKLKEIASLNSKGADIINLGIGSPDMPPPEKAIKKLSDTANDPNNHGYQSYKGTPALRGAFSEFYKRYYKVKLNPESEILPLMGSKEGITYISQTYIQEGDKVLVPNPGYPAYSAAARMAGGDVVFYALEEEKRWMPDLEALAKWDLSRVKIMWVNYPHMPTGAKASDDTFSRLIDFTRKHNILICHDNPYSFILNDNPQSIFSGRPLPDNVLELNSLSKSHNMAGWRVGMLAGHEQHINNILISKSNVDSGMFMPLQSAAVEALKEGPEWYLKLNEEYEERRKVVWQMLDYMNCAYSKDAIGMFVWGKVPVKIKNVALWTDAILYEGNVFVTPGFIFGSNGERYIRISLCNSVKKLKEAFDRIKKIKSLNHQIK